MLPTELPHPEILQALAGAGHGALVLIADGHYPASAATGDRARTVPPAGEPEPPAIAEYRSS